MSEVNKAEVDALDRRVTKLEKEVEPVPRLVAKQHEHANILTAHAGQLDAILGPKDSILTQVGRMKGSIDLLDERLTRIDGVLGEVKGDMTKALEVLELRKIDAAGQWQLRATMATAIMAALSAIAVAALQFM